MIHFFLRNREIKPLPYPYYWFSVFFLTATGLANAVYLSISHYRVYTDIGYRSFCAISKALNCDTVSQSPFSILLGLPVPVWGIIGYTFFMALVLLAWRKDAQPRRIWTMLLLVSTGFSLYSIVLALISSYYIHSYCIMCIISYAIVMLLLFYTWLIRKRFQVGNIRGALGDDFRWLLGRRAIGCIVFCPFLIGVVLVIYLYPVYWKLDVPPIFSDTPTGMTADGHPWIGAENPKLDIVEFADYQCFQCKKMHFFLRRLIAEHPGEIRLVHRHFPMDHKMNPSVKEPFHVGSAAMSLMAIAAISQQRFWQMNDVLYKTDLGKNAINVREVAERAGVDYDALARGMTDKRNVNKLVGDIRQGQKLGVTGTPAFFIEGKLYLGQIPAAVIEKALR